MSTIKHILDELYALDPLLRKKEPEIKKIIEKMMKSRPKIEINEDFRAELREKIMREVIYVKKPSYLLQWGPMVGAFSLFLIFGIWLSLDPLTPVKETSLSFRQNIESAGMEAF